MKKFIFAIILMSSNIFAGLYDIRPLKIKYGEQYVRITKIGTNSVSFEDCLYGQEESTCKFLGNKNAYSRSELTSQRNVEIFQASGLILVETAVLAATSFWSYVVVVLEGETVFAIVSAVAGPVLAISLPALIDGINPIIQTKQALSLRDQIIDDKDVAVENVRKVSERLDLVLSKID